MSKPKSITFHNGTAWSRGHNVRDIRYTLNQEHIDPTLTHNNVNVVDIPVREAYEQIFRTALDEYNAKQKRKDRRITDYYEKIKADKQKNPVYEVIVQVGDRKDTGINASLEKDVLKRFAVEWDKRNPHLKLIGAYIHCDEQDGTVHMHCDYIPVAQFSTGMRLRNSLEQALNQQGFKSKSISETAQMAWQDSEREVLCEICREMSIDAKRNQGIGKGRKYLTPQEFKRAAQAQEEKIQAQLKPLQNELEGYQRLSISVKGSTLQKKKIPFTKRVSVSESELERVEEQARAYIVNRDEIDNVRENQEKNQAQENRLYSLSKELDIQSNRLDEREKRLDRKQQEVNEMYEQQRTVNEQLKEAKESLFNYKISFREHLDEIGELRMKLKQVEEQAKKDLAETQKQLREAYTSLKDVAQAIAMLANDDTGTYKADLSPEQRRLVNAVRRYCYFALEDAKFNDLAEESKSYRGISKEIRHNMEIIRAKEQQHQQSYDRSYYDRGGMSR